MLRPSTVVALTDQAHIISSPRLGKDAIRVRAPSLRLLGRSGSRGPAGLNSEATTP